MIYKSAIPDIETAKVVASSLLKEEVLDAQKLTTGRKNFVVAITTPNNKFVVRMTTKEYKNIYEAAIYWQNKLLPLGVPLAKFIAADLEDQYSPYPTLIMQRAPGDDICNVYKNLSAITKQRLAHQIVNIQKKTEVLPLGSSYGFANSYEQGTKYKSWYEFLLARIDLCQQSLNKTTFFPQDTIAKILAVANNLQADLLTVTAKPFMWDTSERNVIIDHDKISAIVDVDDMCFGDPLFVLGLTYVALESLGFDTIYPDTWETLLNLDHNAQLRLLFYRLFYTVWSMRYYANVSSNNGTSDNMNADILNKMFRNYLL
jgi:aminoglycoside phosphotransferase (APT) family kinase protein